MYFYLAIRNGVWQCRKENFFSWTNIRLNMHHFIRVEMTSTYTFFLSTVPLIISSIGSI